MKKIKCLSLTKYLAGIVILSIMFTCLAISPRPVSAADNIALTIKGDGVNNTVTFTMDQLTAMQTTADYTGYNYFPSLQIYKNTTGVTLKRLFEAAGGLKANATTIKIKSPTTSYNYYTVRDLLVLPRYYFPFGEDGSDCSDWPPAGRGSEEGAVAVDAMIAFINSGKLIYGQQTPLEPTACKGELIEGLLPGCTIEVTTEPLKQWDMPWAEPDSGTVIPGTKVKMHYDDDSLYHTRIYYTLDGSEPTVKSNIFNISYPTFQPQLNKPIPITGEITIKARAIGIGRLDSEVRTFHYSLGALACTFEGAGLSKPVSYAVETLKAMAPATESYNCLENNQPVTLNGQGVLLGTVLDQLNISSRYQVSFITATGEEYAAGTVQELKNQQCMLAYKINGTDVADESGDKTSTIQVLYHGNPNDIELKYVNTIKLINVDDEISINSVKLLNCAGQPITGVAPGGGYCIESKLVNAVNTPRETLLIIQVRSGEGATASSGGRIVGWTAVQTVVDVAGGKARAEFTMPADIQGKAYVDVLVWDNCSSHQPLGKENHELSFNIE